MMNVFSEKPKRNKTGKLNPFFREDTKWEIGVDEAGRGPLFGRLYVAATILPKTCEFKHEWMKDSKRFSSQKKIRDVAEYIKSNAVAWTVRYAEAELIDEINIRQAVLRTMRECCRDLIERMETNNIGESEQEATFNKWTIPGLTTRVSQGGNCTAGVIPRKQNGSDLRRMEYSRIDDQRGSRMEFVERICLLIDGNDFPPFTIFNPESETLEEVESHTVEGGDNLYTCIAAASILAKVARDDYIAELCKENPFLSTNYGIDRNKGYGTADHMRGIREHGITQWHRKSYGPCNSLIDSL